MDCSAATIAATLSRSARHVSSMWVKGSGRASSRQRTSRGQNGIEARNDRFLILVIMTLGAVGTFYGIKTGSS
jgi:hypothetical protein